MNEKDFTKLWEKAEALLKRGRPLMPCPQAEDLEKALHDMAVFHIELDLQNDELRRSHVELESSRNAYSALFEFAPVGYFTLDADGKMLDVNMTGCRQFEMGRAELVGRPFSHYVDPDFQDEYYFHRNRVFDSASRDRCELGMRKGSGGKFHAMLESLLIDHGQDKRNKVLSVLIDISELKQARDEKEELIAELREALKKVKTLSGLIPICAACKKIRDDKGYWEQIEIYIKANSSADFTHSICPDCARALYPNMCNELKKKGIL